MLRNKKGVSLIALIITIIVIIILAAIVMVSSSGTVDKATFAKFEQEFSDFDTAVKVAIMSKKTDYAVAGKIISDRQAICEVAIDEEIGSVEEIEEIKTGNVEDLELNIVPKAIEGEEYYRILDKNKISGYKKQKDFYGPEERLYVTDSGEVFTLPGFPVKQGDEQRYYVNATKYYVGDMKVPSGEKVLPANIEVGDYVQYGPGDIWRVWEINKASNKVVLTSIGNKWRQINFTGGGKIEEWLTAKEEIERLCDELANEEIGITADDIRSMTIEDIEKVIENPGIKQNAAGVKYGESITFKTDNVAYGKATFYAKKSANNTFDGYNTYVRDGIKIEEESDTVEIVNTCWTANNIQFKALKNTKEGIKDQTYLDMFRNSDGDLPRFMLGSPCVGFQYGNGARFLYVLCRFSRKYSGYKIFYTGLFFRY